MEIRFVNTSTNSTDFIQIGENSTVRDALASQRVSEQGVTVRINNAPANLGSALNPNDVVSVTRTDLKGASDEAAEASDGLSLDGLRELAYEDIVTSGQKDVPAGDDTVWNEILRDRVKQSRKVFKGVAADILSDLTSSNTQANNRVERAKKELEAAEAQAKRHAYATHQMLVKNNIFSALAVTGQKGEGCRVCASLGVKLPPADSPLWYTSEEDGKKKS